MFKLVKVSAFSSNLVSSSVHVSLYVVRRDESDWTNRDYKLEHSIDKIANYKAADKAARIYMRENNLRDRQAQLARELANTMESGT